MPPSGRRSIRHSELHKSNDHDKKLKALKYSFQNVQDFFQLHSFQRKIFKTHR